MPVSWVDISTSYDGQRLDNYLIRHCKGVPKARIYRAIRQGEVRVNGKRAKASSRLVAGDCLRVPPMQMAEIKQINFDHKQLALVKHAIIFENDELLVINKSSGLAVHRGTSVRFGVIDLIKAAYPQQSFYLVHRLDRGTSGCLILAKKRSSLLVLHQALREHTMEKTYVAWLSGVWQGDRDQCVSVPLLRNTREQAGRKVMVSSEGQYAVSHFHIEYQLGNLIQARIRIETGRMHQIRVHAAHLGHPVIGDQMYGDKSINKIFKQNYGVKRLCLHARSLQFDCLGECIHVSAPLPDDLQMLLERLQ